MAKDKLIDDLFEAARNEPNARSLESVAQFVGATASSTSTSLIVQWLKQHKMNILISTGGVIVATSLILFPKSQVEEIANQIDKQEQIEVQEELTEMPESNDETIVEFQPEEELKTIPKDSKVEEEEVEMNEEQSAVEVVRKTEEEDEEAKRVVVASSTRSQPTLIDHGSQTVEKKVDVKEYLIVLESAKGQASAKIFKEYLNTHLKQLEHEFSSSASSQKIRKFTLKLDNRREANFRMQVSGFEKLELHWESTSDGKINNVWYRLDSKEIKDLDFSESSKFSIKVKSKHQEF